MDKNVVDPASPGAKAQRMVPEIIVAGNTVRSTSDRPKCSPDFCACWSLEASRMAKRLLNARGPILCMDATAWAAMTAMALDKMMHGGKVVRAERLVKNYAGALPAKPEQQEK